MFKGYLHWFNQTFPGSAHRCPYKEFFVINASNYNFKEEERSMLTVSSNGIQIIRFLFSDEIDKNIFNFTIRLEVKNTEEMDF